MKVYIIFDTSKSSGAESVIGVFDNEVDAKLELAEHVLENEVHTYDLQFGGYEVKELVSTQKIEPTAGKQIGSEKI